MPVFHPAKTQIPNDIGCDNVVVSHGNIFLMTFTNVCCIYVTVRRINKLAMMQSILSSSMLSMHCTTLTHCTLRPLMLALNLFYDYANQSSKIC